MQCLVERQEFRLTVSLVDLHELNEDDVEPKSYAEKKTKEMYETFELCAENMRKSQKHSKNIYDKTPPSAQ